MQNNIKWKTNSNSYNVIVSKNVKNSNTNSDINASCKPLNQSNTCNNFKAQPIKHYRKQYLNLNNSSTGFSKSSYIGSLDKPGNNIVVNRVNYENNKTELCQNKFNQLNNLHLITNNDCSPNLGDKSYDQNKNKVICTAANPQSMIIKSATTVLDNNYSSSYNSYLKNKCKDYKSNLPLKNNTSSFHNKTTYKIDCEANNNCVVHYYPSNRKYSVQGPITSSSRTVAIKYGCSDSKNRRCIIPKTDYNNRNNLTNYYDSVNNKIIRDIHPACIGCYPEYKKSKINLLK
jgi:hypothetical protein